jgi:hypothetical protein
MWLGCIKVQKILDHLSDCHLLKKGCGPYCSLLLVLGRHQRVYWLECSSAQRF